MTTEANSSDSIQIAQVSRALRFFATTVVLGIAYPNIRLATWIWDFHQIFHDMLGNKPLPGASDFVINNQSTFVFISVAIPIAAVIVAIGGSLGRFLYVAGLAVLLEIAQLIIVSRALLIPFTTIIQNMSGNP